MKTEPINMIWKLSFATKKNIVEIGPKDGRYKTEDGREGFGTIDITDELSVDELLNLRNFIDSKIKERAK